MSTDNKAKGAAEPTKYRAPALVKGLEILELLATTTTPMTLSAISEKLQRSRSEIFRMVQELEATGYISRGSDSEGYGITNKLFLLGHEQPRTKTLLETSLPVMREYSRRSGQSCHLAIRSDEFIVVIARMEAQDSVSFAVRVGHRQLISQSTSGVVLFSGLPADERSVWLKVMQKTDKQLDRVAFIERADQCLKDGYFQRQSRFVEGVTDIAAPIFRSSATVAALTSPCLRRIDQEATAGEADLPIDLLTEAAKTISDDLPLV